MLSGVQRVLLEGLTEAAPLSCLPWLLPPAGGILFGRHDAGVHSLLPAQGIAHSGRVICTLRMAAAADFNAALQEQGPASPTYRYEARRPPGAVRPCPGSLEAAGGPSGVACRPCSSPARIDPNRDGFAAMVSSQPESFGLSAGARGDQVRAAIQQGLAADPDLAFHLQPPVARNPSQPTAGASSRRNRAKLSRNPGSGACTARPSSPDPPGLVVRRDGGGASLCLRLLCDGRCPARGGRKGIVSSLPWMDRLARRSTTRLRVTLTVLPVAAAIAMAAPPLQAQPTTSASPTVVRSVPPEQKPNPALEAALREVLFPVRIDDGQGHGPDPGSAEGEWVKRQQDQGRVRGDACAPLHLGPGGSQRRRHTRGGGPGGGGRCSAAPAAARC